VGEVDPLGAGEGPPNHIPKRLIESIDTPHPPLRVDLSHKGRGDALSSLGRREKQDEREPFQSVGIGVPYQRLRQGWVEGRQQ